MLVLIVRFGNAFWAFLLNVFYPKRCICCAKYGNFLCFDCAMKIDKVKTFTCNYCGKISKFGAVCKKCKKNNGVYFDSLIIAADYNSLPVKEMIHNLKYNGLTDIAELCAELIIDAVDRCHPKKHLVITSVPMHRNSEKIRGYNQSKLIAKHLANQLDYAYDDALAKAKATHKQVGLDRLQRKQNLRNAFTLINKKTILGCDVMIVDDVVTTGSTLNECAKVLKENGAKSVIAAVVAKNL